MYSFGFGGANFLSSKQKNDRIKLLYHFFPDSSDLISTVEGGGRLTTSSSISSDNTSDEMLSAILGSYYGSSKSDACVAILDVYTT